MTLPVKQMLEEAAKANVQLKGKAAAAFGSYGWCGEAPELSLESLKNRFGMQIVGTKVMVIYEPKQDKLEECRKLGKLVAEKIAA